MTLQGRYARHENKEISKLLIGTCCVSLLVVLYQLAIAVPRSELQSTTDGFHHGVAAVPCDPLSTRENLDKFQAGSNKYTSKLDEQSQLSTRSKQTICSLRSMHFATRPTAFGKCKKAKNQRCTNPRSRKCQHFVNSSAFTFLTTVSTSVMVSPSHPAILLNSKSLLFVLDKPPCVTPFPGNTNGDFESETQRRPLPLSWSGEVEISHQNFITG